VSLPSSAGRSEAWSTWASWSTTSRPRRRSSPAPRLRDVPPRWLLPDTAPRLLPGLDERLSATADRVLRGRGVDVRTEVGGAAGGVGGKDLGFGDGEGRRDGGGVGEGDPSTADPELVRTCRDDGRAQRTCLPAGVAGPGGIWRGRRRGHREDGTGGA
jgi:hypothetical protein